MSPLRYGIRLQLANEKKAVINGGNSTFEKRKYRPHGLQRLFFVSLAFHTRSFIHLHHCNQVHFLRYTNPSLRYRPPPSSKTEQPWQPIRSDKWSTSSFRRRMRRLMKFVSRWVRVGVFRFGLDTWSIVGWFGVNWARMSLLLLDDRL